MWADSEQSYGRHSATGTATPLFGVGTAPDVASDNAHVAAKPFLPDRGIA